MTTADCRQSHIAVSFDQGATNTAAFNEFFGASGLTMARKETFGYQCVAKPSAYRCYACSMIIEPERHAKEQVVVVAVRCSHAASG